MNLSFLRCSEKLTNINLIWAGVLTLLGLIYVGNAWTPSSYGLVFDSFDVQNTGLIAGKARTGRSDEWAISTPLTQATVNNNFLRFNQTSFYKEDLRSVFSMPIRDWGLAFKPSMWLYSFVNPAYAFSFYHYSFIALFILGYALLFQSLGSSRSLSFLFSLVLFFTGYMQYWWTTFGHLSSYFPWLLILLLNNKINLLVRALLFYWVGVCLMLTSHFYPPLLLQMAFITGLLVIAFRPQHLNLRFLFCFGVSSAAAVLTTLAYLKDPLIGMLTTIFPGQRITSGGGASMRMAVSQFLPSINAHNFQPLSRPNIPESGAIGSYYYLFVLCFVDYRRTLRQVELPVRSLSILLIGLVMTYCWMFIELPSWMGAPLLWNRIPVYRMWFSAGFLTLLLVFLFCRNAFFDVSLKRFVLLLTIFVVGTYFYKYHLSAIPWQELYKDVIAAMSVGVLFLLRSHIRASIFHGTILIISIAIGFWFFGRYNPIQSAWPIFNRPQTLVTQSLDELFKFEEQKKLAVPPFTGNGFPGATLNGWGYPSVSHVQMSPYLEYWRRTFPELDADRFNKIFNRTAHIYLSQNPNLRLINTDIIHVPIDAVTDIFRNVRRIMWEQVSTLPTVTLGHIDSVHCQDLAINIKGWAPWKHLSSKQVLYVASNQTFLNAELILRPRYDVVKAFHNPEYLLSGFTLVASLEAECDLERLAICLISEDSDHSRHLLHGSDLSICHSDG